MPRICLELCALFSNKSQHLLLYLPLENVPKNCLEICAKTCPEIASKSVQKRAQKLPRNLCKLSNKYQHLLLYLPLENVPRNYLGNRALHASSASLFSPSCSLELEPLQAALS